MPDPVPDRIGPYQIIRLLGLGGMAQVYHARKRVEGMELVVAVKVPRQHVVLDRDARDRFVKEARITARMGSHPNIVQVLDVGVDGELPYMALEYITGVDLGRLCGAMTEARTRWPEPAILWVLAGILQGLRHAWGAEVEGRPLRIVHRDISPSNVLVTYEGQVKVTDFGISRMAGLDTSGSIRGKARYMPYEQMMGRACAASDLYAVGAIAWELIEGKPFRHDQQTENELLLATIDGHTPEITRTDVSPRLVQLVTKLLAHDDKHRPQTPMDAWLELKACPGLNLVDPDPLRALVEEFLGQRRQSGYTAVQVRIHPELVATRAALAAVADAGAYAEHVPPAEARTEKATPPGLEAPSPTPPEPTVKWPYDGRAAADGERARRPPPQPVMVEPGDDMAPHGRTISVPPPFPTRSAVAPATRGSRALGLTALGLLVGAGTAFGAMRLMAEPSAEARPPAAMRDDDVVPPVDASGPASSSAPSALAAGAPSVVAEPAAPPATPDPAPSAAPADPPDADPPRAVEPDPAPKTPKPKPVPRATLHVRLDLVPELELRIGSKVRRITGSVTVPAPASTKELAVRTPGSATWYTSRAQLEPGREYLVRLHAKRIELIPLDRGPR